MEILEEMRLNAKALTTLGINSSPDLSVKVRYASECVKLHSPDASNPSATFLLPLTQVLAAWDKWCLNCLATAELKNTNLFLPVKETRFLTDLHLQLKEAKDLKVLLSKPQTFEELKSTLFKMIVLAPQRPLDILYSENLFLQEKDIVSSLGLKDDALVSLGQKTEQALKTEFLTEMFEEVKSYVKKAPPLGFDELVGSSRALGPGKVLFNLDLDGVYFSLKRKFEKELNAALTPAQRFEVMSAEAEKLLILTFIKLILEANTLNQRVEEYDVVALTPDFVSFLLDQGFSLDVMLNLEKSLTDQEINELTRLAKWHESVIYQPDFDHRRNLTMRAYDYAYQTYNALK